MLPIKSNSKIKIFMTSETFLPHLGGAEIHVKNVIENLISFGDEVVLFTNEKQLSDFDHKIKVIRIPWCKKNIPTIFKSLWQNSKGKDIIHSHYCHKMAMLAGIVGRLRGLPVVVTLHGMGILDPTPKTPWVYRQAHAFYRYSSLKLCTKVISTSQDLAEVAYRYISKDKVIIISNGYEAEVFNDQVSVIEGLVQQYRGKKIILTVRRLVPKNGIHYLVEAMSYVKKEVPEAIFLAAGPGRMMDYIKSRIEALGLSEDVILLGEVANNEIPQYLKLAEVIVFPSTAESSSIACAEAMAMKKKVVASRVGGLVELLGENEERGTLVKLVDWQGSNYDAPISLPDDRYRALAKAIIENLQEGKNEDKAEKAYRYAKDNLSWRVISKKTEQVYKQIINIK